MCMDTFKLVLFRPDGTYQNVCLLSNEDPEAALERFSEGTREVTPWVVVSKITSACKNKYLGLKLVDPSESNWVPNLSRVIFAIPTKTFLDQLHDDCNARVRPFIDTYNIPFPGVGDVRE